MDPLKCGEFRYDADKVSSTVQIGHKVPPHGGNVKLTGGNPIMRTRHKDGVTTD